MRRKITFTVGVFVEELLLKSGVRDGQDLGQMEKMGHSQRAIHGGIAAVVVNFREGHCKSTVEGVA